MILFYKMRQDDYAMHKGLLDISHKDLVRFSDGINGGEQVIVVDQLEHLNELRKQRPSARIVVSLESEYDIDPRTALVLAREQNVHDMAARSNVVELVDRIGQAYLAEPGTVMGLSAGPTVRLDGNNMLQVDGLVNNRLIGVSDGIADVLKLMAKFLRTTEDILIVGENGSGKDVAASILMDNAQEKYKVPINMAEFSEELIASELFGHVKGAFTGANEDKVGFLSKYQNGLIFMDEIGELSTRIQAKLLRFFQNREYRRVGDTEIKKSTSRILMATNRDPEQMVAEGLMRPDFCFRVCQFVITIPPLKDRRVDIPYLVHDVVQRMNGTRKQTKTIAPGAMDFLTDQDWPGNVRQLISVVKNLHIREDGQTINMETVKEFVRTVRSPGLVFGSAVHSASPNVDKGKIDLSHFPESSQNPSEAARKEQHNELATSVNAIAKRFSIPGNQGTSMPQEDRNQQHGLDLR